MSYYGKHVVAHDTDIGITGVTTNNERATIFPAITENGWATAYGIWGGRANSGQNATLALCHWSDFNNAPNTVRARSSSFTVSTDMFDGNGGASYTSNITWSDSIYPSRSSAQLFKGTPYAVGFLSTGNQFSHAQNADGTVMFIGSVASQPPGGFVSGTSNPEGQIDVWIVYTPNTSPTIPTGLSPTGTGITTLTPTFNANFVDAESSIGDQMSSYTIQLRAVGTTTDLWNSPYTATATEKAANQVQIPYGGTTLTAGVAYEWRVMVFDMFGAGSIWTNNAGPWQSFTVNLGGTITIPSGATPTGKQLAVNGYTFMGQWTHGSALAMKKLTVDILQNNQVVRTNTLTVNIPSSASPGTSFTTTFAALGFANLSYSSSYQWRMKGQDSALIDSPYSALTTFSVDSYPDMPTGLSPTNNTPVSSPPKLTATGTDFDDTPTALGGNLTETAKIYGSQTLLNAAFAKDITGWTDGVQAGGVTSAWTWDNVGAFILGSVRNAITANSNGANTYLRNLENTATWNPVVAGESYTVRATVQTDTANLHPLLGFYWYDINRGYLSNSPQTDWAPTINTASPTAFTAAAPANAVYARVALYTRGAAANVTGNIYATAFSVDQGVRAKPAMTYNVSTSLWEYQTISGTNDIDTISFGGTVSGGNWSLTFNGANSGNILWNASAATVQTALQAMTTFGTGNVLVTGGPGPASYVLTFAGALRGTPQNSSSVTNVNLTGTAPTISVTETTVGASTGLSVYGNIAWSCAGFDGTLQGASSPLAHFVYAAGPAVTVTAPANGATITTSTPTITWTTTGQVKYRVVVSRDADSVIVYDTGTITSSATSITLPASVLLNGFVYDIQVFITDATPLTGSNTPNVVTLTYTAPPTLATTTSPYSLAQDNAPSAVLISWPPSSVSPSTFAYYIVDRRISGADVSTATVLQIHHQHQSN